MIIVHLKVEYSFIKELNLKPLFGKNWYVLRSKKKKCLIVNNEAKQSLIALYKGFKSHILPLKSHPQPTRNSCDRSGGQEKGSNSSNDGIHMHGLSYLQMSGRVKGLLPTTYHSLGFQ